MSSEFLISESSSYQPPELTPVELTTIDQARISIAEQRTDSYRQFFTGVTADGMFVSVDRPTNNNFAECAIWTGDIGEMTVGAAPTKHEVSGGYQMRHTPHGSGPGQFGPVMTRFRNTQGDMVKIQVPAGVDLAMAKRPTISDASGSRLIFTFWDFPEDTLASSSAAEQAEPAETVTARSSQITADGLRSVFSRWKKRK